MAFPTISTEQLYSRDWQDFITMIPGKEHYRISSALFAQANALEKEDRKSESELYRFFGLLMELRLQVDNTEQPYVSWRTSGGGEQLPDAIDQPTLTALSGFSEKIRHSELRGRVNDILWLGLGRKREHAKSACEAFIDSVKSMMDANAGWPSYVPLIQRALVISRSLGRNSEVYRTVCEFVESLVDKRAVEETELTSAELIECLIEQRWGDPSGLAQKSQSIAENINSRNPGFARRYWRLAAQLWRFEKRLDEAKAAELRHAETYVLEAKAATTRPTGGKMAAAHFLGQAVVALRGAGASAERIDEIHHQFLEAQSRIHEEMGKFSHPVDLSEAVKATHGLLVDKSLQESLVLLGAMNKPLPIADLKKQVMEQAKAAPLSFLIEQTIMDQRGRTRARVPALLGLSSGVDDEALNIHMVRYLAQFIWQIRSMAKILPAIDVIAQEHNPRIRDFQFLVENNPFVPVGRESFFARGLHAGLHRDFATAGHYLIPEVENSLRSIAEARGGIPLNLSNELVQTDYGINKLLSMAVIKDALGEDLVFELKALLCAQVGGNLRHQFAHGMMDESEFYQYEVICLWGQVLRLCAFPFMRDVLGKRKASSGAGETHGAAPATE